jgi:hypothetical protein
LNLFPVAQHRLQSPSSPWSLPYRHSPAESVFIARTSHLHS